MVLVTLGSSMQWVCLCVALVEMEDDEGLDSGSDNGIWKEDENQFGLRIWTSLDSGSENGIWKEDENQFENSCYESKTIQLTVWILVYPQPSHVSGLSPTISSVK